MESWKTSESEQFEDRVRELNALMSIGTKAVETSDDNLLAMIAKEMKDG